MAFFYGNTVISKTLTVAHSTGEAVFAQITDRVSKAANYLVPIPRAEVDKSQGTLPQNHGYE